MHILLTDVLTCPRCGPEFGLIVLADRMDDRDVVEGRLGCANCRASYPVAGGRVDLRAGEPSGNPEEFERDGEWGFRMAALLGTGEGRGPVVVAGPGAARVDEIAAHLRGGLPVAAFSGAEAERGGGGNALVLPAERLPFRSRSLQGVVLTGGTAETLLEEAARALAPGARVVADPAPPEAAARLASGGLTVLLEQEGVVVASSG